jgi:translation initiation factor 2B subunit (eIF-2B alpha/beta/delta family)
MNPEGWNDIRGAATDRHSGAAEIVRRAAEAVAALPREDVEAALLTLVRGQFSMAPVWRLATDVLNSADHAQTARDFAIQVGAEAERVAEHAAPLLSDPVVAHSYSSAVIAAVAAADVRAICARSDPGGEGARTAARLAELRVAARLVDDDEAVASVADAAIVVVGADAIGPGGIVNKVGTRALAEAASRHGTPCYSLAGASKLLAVDLPAPDPFERTPLDLFTFVITPEGPWAPDEVARRVTRYTVHPVLRGIFEKPN